MRSLTRLRPAVCSLALAALLASGCSALSDDTGGAAPPGGRGAAGGALAALDDLAVKEPGSGSGYEREEFGRSWVDTDHNDCDTRDDILRRDLTGRRTESDGCRIGKGLLDDPYTGKEIRFVRGGASEVDIDHVVALSDAWRKGASTWPRDRRVAFANDPLNLLAVDASTNRTKSDGDASAWLPPDRSFRCAYVARQIAVKKTYKVSVTRAEKTAMEGVLKRCPDEPLPSSGKPSAVGGGAATGGDTDGGGGPSDGGGSSGGDDATYENCAAAREAGAAPLHRGDPGYSTSLDRDGDGVACDA